MNAQLLLETHNKLKIQHSRVLIFLGVSMLLNLILSGSIFKQMGAERIMVIPPLVSREFWFSANAVSDSYLEQMTEFFAGLLLNVTPNTFTSRSEHLLQHVDSSTYAALKSQLVEQQMEIERRAMSTSFYPTSFKIDRHKLLVELKGVLKVLIGNTPLEPQSKTYQIKYVQRHGRLYIQSFTEVSNA